jgi:hypothetical protein
MAKDKVRDLIKRLKGISIEEQGEALAEIINRNQAIILDLNKQQLMEGIDSKGRSLGEYANEAYAKMKMAFNPMGVVDLRLVGDFHDNFFLASELPIQIWSYDEKTDWLVKKYGRDLFGTTEKNTQVFVLGTVKPEFQAWQKDRMLRV